MNIARTSLSSPHIGLRVLMLLLAWVMVASFSWADLFNLHDEVGRALVDLQQATEPDLDEIRDDTATIWLVEERLTRSLSIRPSPIPASYLPSTDGAPLPPHSLLPKLSVYRL